jgi:hypothetical protein
VQPGSNNVRRNVCAVQVERELALPSSHAQGDSVSASGTSTTDNAPTFPTTASPNPSGLTLASAADGLKGGVVNTREQGVVYDTAVHGALKQRQRLPPQHHWGLTSRWGEKHVSRRNLCGRQTLLRFFLVADVGI